MGKVNDIAIVGAIKDILEYDVTLMFTEVNDTFHVTITWISLADDMPRTGAAYGTGNKLYLALSLAYKEMISLEE
jgi:hypothetical protein